MAIINADYDGIDSFGQQFNNSQDAYVGSNVGYASEIKKNVESIWSGLEDMQYAIWNGKMYRELCGMFTTIKPEFEKIINATLEIGNDLIDIAKLYRDVDNPNNNTSAVGEDLITLQELDIVIADESAPFMFVAADYETEMSLISGYIDSIKSVISKIGETFDTVTWSSNASRVFLSNRITNYSSNCGDFVQTLKTKFDTFKDDFKDAVALAEESNDVSSL